MLILGVESATDLCGCALACENGLIAETRVLLRRRHAELLAPQIRFLCEQTGVSLRDLDAVAVDVGPGLYTGLRAGLATAQATAQATGVPVVAVCSLEALAFGASSPLFLSVLDARRGEVFWACYSASEEGELSEVAPPAVGPPERLLEYLEVLELPFEHFDGQITVAGDGAHRYLNVLAASPQLKLAGGCRRFPSPAAVALLGLRRAADGNLLAAEAVEPVYLRSPDAEKPVQS